MGTPSVHLRTPDGRLVAVGPEGIVGRSRVADVHLDDPRISTVHAEISWRQEGFVVLARGGRVVVDGAPRTEAPLVPGTRLLLVPGVVLEVERVESGEAAPVPPTAGREWLRFAVHRDHVAVFRADDREPGAIVDGLPGRLLAELLGGGALPWDVLAARLWPEEGELRRGPRGATGWTVIDERRYRNRFDQVVATLRTRLRALPQERALQLRQGELALVTGPRDRVERCGPA